MGVDSILMRQRQFNRRAFDNWLRCESHRLVVTKLLLPKSFGNRLTLAGVGNGNDVDLAVLSRHYSAMTLVDIDREAMLCGLARQDRLNSECSVEVAQCDLSSGSWLNSERSEVTASLCMFSQLVEQMPKIESNNQRLVDELRRSHLHMLVNNTKTGGRVVFVSDLVSAVTAPDIDSLSCGELTGRVGQLLEAGNFFVGTHPHHAASDMRDHDRVLSMEVHEPWLWHFGKRCFVVYAVVAQL